MEESEFLEDLAPVLCGSGFGSVGFGGEKSRLRAGGAGVGVVGGDGGEGGFEAIERLARDRVVVVERATAARVSTPYMIFGSQF